MSEYPYVMVDRVSMPHRLGQRCRIFWRWRLSLCVEFEDGEKAIVLKEDIRKVPAPESKKEATP